MKHLRTLIVALGVTMLLPVAAQSADTATQPADTTATQPGEAAATPAKCLEAAVNPVTGSAYCVNPRGAPVEPPHASRSIVLASPGRTTFTVYEHCPGARWTRPGPVEISARYPAQARAAR